jgi:hypothetical protein
LGIRVALGAQRKQVLKAALGRAFKLLAWGSTAGLFLGILASRGAAGYQCHIMWYPSRQDMNIEQLFRQQGSQR